MMPTRTPVDEPDGGQGPEPGSRRLAPPPTRQAGVDRFDEAIVVTRTRAWIGLAACLALVLGVIVWATITQVDRTLKGNGVALIDGTLTPVLSPATGTIVSLSVGVSDVVEPSEVIGEISTPADERVPIRAPIGGRVLSLSEKVGSTLRAEETVVTLGATEGPVVVKLFLPPAEAQQLDPGMPAKVSLPQGETLDGEVSAIGVVPMTMDDVAEAIGSQALAPLVASSDGVIEVNVTLSSDEDTSQLTGADVAEVTLIVGSQRPIEYVF